MSSCNSTFTKFWNLKTVLIRFGYGTLEVENRLNPQAIVWTTCSKPADNNLQQVWFSQLASTLMRSSNLLQVVPSDLSKLVIHKLAASWWNNLHQVCKCQLAASLIFSTCISIDVFTDLLQVVLSDLSKLDIHRLDASWWNNLHQVCKCQLAASLIFSTCISIDAFIRLAASCSIRLVASWYLQTWCNLFHQLASSLQMSTCSKPDFNRLAASWRRQQACCNLLTTCSRPVKSANCSKSVAFLAVYRTASV